MILSEKCVRDFEFLLHKHYPHIEFSNEEIRAIAIRTMRAVGLVYERLTVEQLKVLKAKQDTVHNNRS
jgi:hypothetical protein